ncbi:MAG: metal-dependent transcriptional regulator [Sulfolobales archaeon]
MKSRRLYEYLAIVGERIIEHGESSVRLKEISRRINVKPSSAREYMRRLIEEGYVKRDKRGRYTLTEFGLRELERVMWAHGVIETFLYRVLGIDPDTACRIASKIEYLVPEEAVERLCKLLDHPHKCPHDQEIPHKDSSEGVRRVFLRCFLYNISTE